MGRIKEISKNKSIILIDQFFSKINLKTNKEVKKIKNLAKSNNLKLKDKKKLFCKKCLNPFSGLESIRIKDSRKIVRCNKCNKINKWKI